MKKYFKKFVELLLMVIEDLFIIGGVLIINAATYKINLIAGMYATGVTFLLIGIYFVLYPVKKRG